MKKKLAGRFLLQNLDCDHLFPPDAAVHIGIKPNSDLHLPINLIPRDRPAWQRHVYVAEPTHGVDPGLDKLAVESVPRRGLVAPVTRRLSALYARNSRAPAQVHAALTRPCPHDCGRADRRNEHRVLLVRVALSCDLALERALQRFDSLGHFITSDLENVDHLYIVVRLQRAAHELPQVRSIMRKVVLVLLESDSRECRTDLIRVRVHELLDRRDGTNVESVQVIHTCQLDWAFLGHERESAWLLVATMQLFHQVRSVNLTLLLCLEDLFEDANLDRELEGC